MQLELTKDSSQIYNIDALTNQESPMQPDLSYIRVYSNCVKSSIKVKLKDVIENNAILQVIIAIRNASPLNEGFSFPIRSPIHIADLLSNSSFLALDSLFDYVNLRADADKGLIYSINCGPLKRDTREQFQYLFDSDKLDLDVKNLFPTYSSFDVTSDCSPKVVYKINIEGSNNENEFNFRSNPILYYITWALSLFYNPICQIPYYNRKVCDVENDLIIEKIASISKYLYINGIIVNGQWLSQNIIVKQLHPYVINSFNDWLWH